MDVTAYASNVFDFDEDNVAQTIKLGGGSSKCIKKPLPAPEGGTAVFCSVARTFLDAEALSRLIAVLSRIKANVVADLRTRARPQSAQENR